MEIINLLTNKLYTYRTIVENDESPNWNPHHDTRIKNLFSDLCKALDIQRKDFVGLKHPRILLNHCYDYPALDGYCKHTVTIILIFDDNVSDDLREIIEQDRSAQELREVCEVNVK